MRQCGRGWMLALQRYEKSLQSVNIVLGKYFR